MKDFDDRPSNICKCGRELELFERVAFKGKHCRECYLRKKEETIDYLYR
jgi:hypothetical protein